ncbi:hypothetical protein ACSBR2_039671 [Camellia fascicularis]
MKHNGMEESTSNDICGSEVKGNDPEECCKEKEEDVEVAGVKVHSLNSGMVVSTVVEETKHDVIFNRDNGAYTKEAEQREGLIDCHMGEESAKTLMEETMHCPKVSKHNSKSVIYRPAAAVMALSDLSEGATSPNNYLLKEAKATLQLGNLVESISMGKKMLF